MEPDQKRLLRPEHRARNVLETDHADLVHDLLARHRETCDHIAVAVEILGRAVHDNICAQLQRLHQQRRGEGVVHDDEAARIQRMRIVRYGGDVRDLHAGVGDGLKIDDLRVRADGRFYLRHVRHVDAVGADAETRQRLVDACECTAVERLVRHKVVAAAEQRQQRGRDGAHAGRERRAVLAALQQRDFLLQLAGGEVAETKIDVAALLPGEAAAALLGGVKDEGGGLENRRRQCAEVIVHMVAVDDDRRGSVGFLSHDDVSFLF